MIEQDRDALRSELAAALDREAGTQDALDDALRRVASLEAARDVALGLLRGIDYDEDSRIDRAVRALEGE